MMMNGLDLGAQSWPPWAQCCIRISSKDVYCTHANKLQQLPEKLQSIPALCILMVRCGNGKSELINHQLNKPPALSRWKQSFFHTNTNILTLAQTPTQHLVSSVSADPFVFASGALALLETTGTNIIRSKWFELWIDCVRLCVSVFVQRQAV